MANVNPYSDCVRTLDVDGKKYRYYSLPDLGDAHYGHLPFAVRVLLESAVRHCDGFQVKKRDVEALINWQSLQGKEVEIAFRPARVLLQDFTGVPAVVDFAAMRDAVQRLGGDPRKINPLCPSDLVVDHSIQVDFSRILLRQAPNPGGGGCPRPRLQYTVCPFHGRPAVGADALQKNQDLEFERNKERFRFLKWGSQALENMRIVPPGSGIVHQVNLEFLGRVVFHHDGWLYPDSLVGADSHTTMINGLGVLGWGVGGIEAEAVMLGQTTSMLLPPVVGYQLSGRLPAGATSTDLVLTITKHLRQVGVVGKFVEFFGPGVAQLSIADRATVSNMCPEYGATVGFFPVDVKTLEYLRQTGRDEQMLRYAEAYLVANRMLRNYLDASQDPVFSQVVELDLASVVPSLSGPKRPQDRVAMEDLQQDFKQCLSAKVGFKGYGLKPEHMPSKAIFSHEGQQHTLQHGSIVIAAITSCTNTSNPSVMLGAGLLAKKAVERGLSVAPYIKTSLSPGSGVVTYYLQESGVVPYLEKLGFNVVGYGCMTCIGNSGPLPDPVVDAIEKGDLVAVGILSGNRNFEGRVHPNTRANYLASPLLVVAYAIAGTVDIDLDKEPLGHSPDGKPVLLRDIWPSREEIQAVESEHVLPRMFKEVYSKVETGSKHWQALDAPTSLLYPWDSNSTYIKCPPFFETMEREPRPMLSIEEAYVLLNLGDSVTTDHISPAGSIARNSPAARYLAARGLTPREFNSYGSRRGNDDVMARGTFANIRLVNKFLDKPGPRTIYLPSGEEAGVMVEQKLPGLSYADDIILFADSQDYIQWLMDIFDAAERYKKEGAPPLMVLAGKEYGSGSSRDWAAKGPFLLGIRVVLAESYERIHRSNLVGMGIVPLQYLPGQNAQSLNLTGRERFTLHLGKDLVPGQRVTLQLSDGRSVEALLRFDTEVELAYFHHGGILPYVLRQML